MPRAQATVSRVEYVPEFGRSVRIREFDRPMQSDDIETAQTISYMDELAAADADDPQVTAAFYEALSDAGITTAAEPLQIAQAVFWWLKRNVRLVPTPGTSPLVDQTLISPSAVLAMPEPIGDCPQFSMLAAAMFRVACMNSLFVTIAAERSFPEQWSHIYNTVEVSPGRFLPFDSSHGPEPGAEYARPFKRRVWPRLTPGLCTPGTRQKGKAMVRSSYAANAGRGMRSHTLRGNLGDCSEDDMGNTFCTDSTITYDTTPGSGVLTPGVLDPTDCLYGVSPSTGGCNGAPGTPVMTSTPPGSGAPGGLTNAQLAAILGNSAVNAAAPAIKLATQQTPYYVTNPVTGQSVLYNPNTGTLSGASTALSSALSPSVLLMLGLGIAAIALIGKK